MKKASINLNKNRRRNITLSQDLIDELKVEYQQKEAQTTVQGEAAKRDVIKQEKQLTLDDARKQAEEIKQKKYAKTRVSVATEEDRFNK